MKTRALNAVIIALSVLVVACESGTPTSATSDRPVITVIPFAGPVATGLTVEGTTTGFTTRGATAQFTAVVSMSNGTTQDSTARATWRSSDPAVATVTASGLVTAQGDGAATISATVDLIEARRAVSVQTAPPAPPTPPTRRTPDPAPGARLPLPDVQAVIAQANAERPGFIFQSCPTGRKYENNPWLDYILDRLRTLDTRWGYNGKPSRTPADNDGFPVIAAGDEIAYHFGSGPDEGSRDVHLIDILSNHCGPTPALTWRVFTGEEPGFWTGARRF